VQRSIFHSGAGHTVVQNMTIKVSIHIKVKSERTKIQAWHTDDNQKRNIMHPRMHETLYRIRTNLAVTEWNLFLKSD